MTTIKFELESWSDAELKILGAIALSGIVEEYLYQSGSKADSEALMGIRMLLEGAMADMDGGRFYGKSEVEANVGD